jgi:hypothetical protein
VPVVNAADHNDQPDVTGEEEVLAPATDLALRATVLELERYAAEAGWDQPARLFALVLTEELVANEPSLAEMLELEPGQDLTNSLTPVEQDDLPGDEHLEELLSQMMWPDTVHGAAVTVERLVLPPTVELPEDEAEAMQLAATHPEREEVRMVAAAPRRGSTYCAMRLRSHDDDFAVVEGPDLIPALLELLQGTLTPVDRPDDGTVGPADPMEQ